MTAMTYEGELARLDGHDVPTIRDGPAQGAGRKEGGYQDPRSHTDG